MTATSASPSASGWRERAPRFTWVLTPRGSLSNERTFLEGASAQKLPWELELNSVSRLPVPHWPGHIGIEILLFDALLPFQPTTFPTPATPNCKAQAAYEGLGLPAHTVGSTGTFQVGETGELRN